VGRTRRALLLGPSIQTAESHVYIALYLYVFTPPHSIVGPSYKKSSPGRSNRPSGMGPTAPPSYICTTEARHNTGNLKQKTNNNKIKLPRRQSHTFPQKRRKQAELQADTPLPRSSFFVYIHFTARLTEPEAPLADHCPVIAVYIPPSLTVKSTASMSRSVRG
jgi:hypothetical protein